MDKKAVINHLKQTKIPLPGLLIVITWLLISYLLYPHKVQKPEVRGISDSRVTQVKPTPTIAPTPKVSTPTPTSELTPTVFQSAINPSVTQGTSPVNNSTVNSDTSDSDAISPTQVPSTAPTITPQPSPNTIEGATTPAPTPAQQSNGNNTQDNNNLATTVNTLTQSLPIGLNIPR